MFRRHTVVATVRSKIKGDQMLAAHGSTRAERLSYVIVSDIASRGAFDKVSFMCRNYREMNQQLTVDQLDKGSSI